MGASGLDGGRRKEALFLSVATKNNTRNHKRDLALDCTRKESLVAIISSWFVFVPSGFQDVINHLRFLISSQDKARQVQAPKNRGQAQDHHGSHGREHPGSGIQSRLSGQ
jgi:hypothetical protein